MDQVGKIDLKAKIEEIVKKVKEDEKLQEQFKKDPLKAVESLLGVKLPEETIQKIIEGVKAKITADKLGEGLGKLSGILGKKEE